MKRAALIFSLVLILISGLMAQEDPQNIIMTHGKVKLEIPADYATLSFSVSAEGRTLREAFAIAKKDVGAIISTLEKLGIEKSCISTSHFNTGENYNGSLFYKNDKYETKITTHVKIKKLETLEPVILAISDENVERIYNISFNLENPEKHKTDALEKACEKAKEKVSILANVMDSQITKTVKINEIITPDIQTNSLLNVRGGRVNPFNAAYKIDGFESESGSAILPKVLTITAEVELVVEIK